MSTEMTQTVTPKSEFLIEEYKLCHDYATHMDSIAWQMAAVLLPVSFASLAYLFSLPGTQSIVRLAITAIVSTISVAILWAWLQLFKRWLAYQQIAYYRMVEIEDALGLRLVTYGQILRGGGESESRIKQRPEHDELSLHLRRRFDQFPRRKTKVLISFVIRILIGGWVLLVIAELARTLLM